MDYSEATRLVAKRTRLKTSAVRRVLAEMFDPVHGPIAEAMTMGDSVTIPDFGTFVAHERAYQLTEDYEELRQVAAFEPATTLKAAVAGKGAS